MSSLAFTSSTSSGAAGVVAAPSVDNRAPGLDIPRAAPDKCPTAWRAVRFYARRLQGWKASAGTVHVSPKARATGSGCPRHLAHVLQRKTYAARIAHERWLDKHMLHDFVVRDGNRAWHRAVREAQRPYPGTEAWLLSCSASEGGHGRWVPNSQGSGVGGWLQFMPGTWAGFYRHAVNEVQGRGFVVPSVSASWYSPLGQALAGAWGITHGMQHHWAGGGC